MNKILMGGILIALMLLSFLGVCEDAKTVATHVRHIGALLDKEDRAEEIIGFVEKYQDIVEERTDGLKEEDKPEVFFEWSRPYYSMGNGTLFHNLTVAAGGINIVADEVPNLQGSIHQADLTNLLL